MIWKWPKQENPVFLVVTMCLVMIVILSPIIFPILINYLSAYFSTNDISDTSGEKTPTNTLLLMAFGLLVTDGNLWRIQSFYLHILYVSWQWHQSIIQSIKSSKHNCLLCFIFQQTDNIRKPFLLKVVPLKDKQVSSQASILVDNWIPSESKHLPLF